MKFTHSGHAIPYLRLRWVNSYLNKKTLTVCLRGQGDYFSNCSQTIRQFGLIEGSVWEVSPESIQQRLEHCRAEPNLADEKITYSLFSVTIAIEYQGVMASTTNQEK